MTRGAPVTCGIGLRLAHRALCEHVQQPRLQCERTYVYVKV